MINLTSPTRTNYAIRLDQGTVTSGTVSFASKSVEIVPQNGLEVALVQATSVDGAIQNQPKESN
jgi:hypothetical protein